MKLAGWMIMLTAMIVFLTLLGFETGLDSLLSNFGIEVNPNTEKFEIDTENSSFWDDLFGIEGILVIIVGGGAILIGLFGKGYDVSLIYAPFVIIVGGIFAKTFWTIMLVVISYEQFWMTSIIGLIFSALSIGFAMACVDYFGGR